ncbi:hypothetical protein [Flectobacillus major]|uniref:hypothetical protein n=1 Tax=Flectobacillus major TaxID=103 RepID=UPI00047BF5CA|nr:hypothetical protein [Flectobacillus major]
MKKIISILGISFFAISISCKDKENIESVRNSKILMFYSELEVSHQIRSYFHTVYVGNYVVKDSTDELFLLKRAMKYVDTISHHKPVSNIVFINDTLDYPKYMDDEFRFSDDYKKKRIFQVSFNEDSLVKGKYYVNFSAQMYPW